MREREGDRGRETEVYDEGEWKTENEEGKRKLEKEEGGEHGKKKNIMESEKQGKTRTLRRKKGRKEVDTEGK